MFPKLNNLYGVILFVVILNVFVLVSTIWGSFANPTLLGLVLLAYGLGLRHAVDADHIAAIDNTTRKLMSDGQRPVAVGLYFSLGHSTIVILLSLLLAISASFVTKNLPIVKEVGTSIGLLVSSAFLLLIGLINFITLIDIFRLWSKVTHGRIRHQSEIHTHLHAQGFLAKLFKPFLNAVTKSRDMYWVGFLFGLGFDTASEVGLLTLSAATGAKGVPVWEMLLLPLAFTAGMSLIDTLDGILMLNAYGWAYINPIRKLYYNMNITFISVIIAVFLGSMEVVQLVTKRQYIDTGSFGYVIIVAFILSWAVSVVIYKLKGYDKIVI